MVWVLMCKIGVLRCILWCIEVVLLFYCSVLLLRSELCCELGVSADCVSGAEPGGDAGVVD